MSTESKKLLKIPGQDKIRSFLMSYYMIGFAGFVINYTYDIFRQLISVSIVLSVELEPQVPGGIAGNFRVRLGHRIYRHKNRLSLWRLFLYPVAGAAAWGCTVDTGVKLVFPCLLHFYYQLVQPFDKYSAFTGRGPDDDGLRSPS